MTVTVEHTHTTASTHGYGWQGKRRGPRASLLVQGKLILSAILLRFTRGWEGSRRSPISPSLRNAAGSPVSRRYYTGLGQTIVP